MKRRTFIKGSLPTGSALTITLANMDYLSTLSKTTLIGIGGAGVTIVNKAKNAYKEKVNCVGIDTKGHWNTFSHDLIHIDYKRPAAFSAPGIEFVQFYISNASVDESWANNYSKLEPVFETGGKLIVVAGIKGTMGGIVGHKIIREIAKRRNAQITFLAVAPFSFEGSKPLTKQYALVNETGKLCTHMEVISNADLIKGYGNDTLFKAFAIADEKIVDRLGQLI